MLLMDTRRYTSCLRNSMSRFVGMLFGPEVFEDIICDSNERISLLSHGIKNRLFIFEFPRNEEKCILAAEILPSIVIK